MSNAQTTPSIEFQQDEFMRLAPGTGIIPAAYRNRGYEKLGIAPGSGGLGELLDGSSPAKEGATDMRAFLAGVAAGADPQELAKQLLDEQTTKPRRRAAA